MASPSDSGAWRRLTNSPVAVGAIALVGVGMLLGGLMAIKSVADVVYVSKSEFIPVKTQMDGLASQLVELRLDMREQRQTIDQIRDAVVKEGP